MIIPRDEHDYPLALLLAVKKALYSGGAPDPELDDARGVLDALSNLSDIQESAQVLVAQPTAEQVEQLKQMLPSKSHSPILIEERPAWLSVVKAPRNGSWFITYTPDTDSDATYDLARFDAELGEFIKVGCGFQYVTRCLPLPPVNA